MIREMLTTLYIKDILNIKDQSWVVLYIIQMIFPA